MALRSSAEKGVAYCISALLRTACNVQGAHGCLFCAAGPQRKVGVLLQRSNSSCLSALCSAPAGLVHCPCLPGTAGPRGRAGGGPAAAGACGHEGLRAQAGCSHEPAALVQLLGWAGKGAYVCALRPSLGGSVQHSTAQHGTAQHAAAQYGTARHSTAQHSAPQLLQVVEAGGVVGGMEVGQRLPHLQQQSRNRTREVAIEEQDLFPRQGGACWSGWRDGKARSCPLPHLKQQAREPHQAASPLAPAPAAPGRPHCAAGALTARRGPVQPCRTARRKWPHPV